jgi:hypothetical protein
VASHPAGEQERPEERAGRYRSISTYVWSISSDPSVSVTHPTAHVTP